MISKELALGTVIIFILILASLIARLLEVYV